MKRKIFRVIALFIILTGSLASCKKEDLSGTYNNVTGTIIGSYSNAFASILVQVDKKYPIGKTIKYVNPPCKLFLPKYGTYKNMIQVQVNHLPLSNLSENEALIGKRISFSYRDYCYGEEDAALFDSGQIGDAFCTPPDIPMCVITDGQILN